MCESFYKLYILVEWILGIPREKQYISKAYSHNQNITKLILEKSQQNSSNLILQTFCVI